MKKLITIIMTTLISVAMWGNTYYYSGEGNGKNWAKTAMNVSSDGMYEYYQISTNTTHKFKIGTSSDQWAYNYSYVTSGFNGTNVTEIGDWGEDNCYCWKGSEHYILVYYPNTLINATSKPIICASTTLPNDVPVTMYFVNVPEWTTVKAFVWPATGNAYKEWSGEAMTKVPATKVNGHDVYSYTFPSKYVNIIFNDGEDNKTADLTWAADKPYFCPTAKNNDSRYTAKWYANTAGIPKFHVTGDSALVVDAGLDKAKAWNVDAIPSMNDTLVLQGLKANQEYKLKVTSDAEWKGFEQLSTISSGISADGDNNVVFKLKSAGDVTVVYVAGSLFKVLGSFVEPPFDPTTQYRLKLVPYRWENDNAKMAVYTWSKTVTGKWSAFFTGDGDTLQTAIRQSADSMVLVRFNNNVSTPTWDNEETNVWNKIDKILIDKVGLTYTIVDWNHGSWEAYVPPVPENKTVKLVPSEEWNVANAKFAAWTWGEEQDGKWTDFFTPKSEGNDTLVATIKTSADSIDFVRFSPKATAPTWEQQAESDVLVWGELKDTIDWTGLTASVVGWDSLTWKTVERQCESYGLLINGVYRAGQKNVLQSEWLEYKLLSVNLEAGDKLQVHNNCEPTATWVISTYASTSYEFPIEEGKYVVNSAGTYDFYLKLIPGHDEIYISKAGHYTQSVPSACEDVMIQAFFNESYNNSAPGVSDSWALGNTKWTTLSTNAEALAHSFDLIWLPPSAFGDGMGYHPKNYGDQSSNWGTRAELDTLISRLHQGGSKVIADIVINHCQSTNGWLGFPTFNFGDYGSYSPDASYICKNDEVNLNPEAGDDYGKATGNYDDGENWEGARDWAHDMPKVQSMFKAYLQWMRDTMKFDGFRYDKGDGFNNWHHDNYNKAAGPYIAFMECYSGTDEIQWRIGQANNNLMALDFDTKWHVFNAIAGFQYPGRGDGLLGRGQGHYAIEFIDSHDWFLREDNQNEFGGSGNSLKPELKDRLLQANAFLLSMPGVPCVFYPHWKKYTDEIDAMIAARKWAGVHSDSPVSDESVSGNNGGYQATIEGKYGYLILQLGDKTTHTNTGDYSWLSNYELKASGPGYAMWVNRTAPVPTGVNNTETQVIKAEKFMKDGKMYIRLGNKTYDLMGRSVK